MACILVLYAIVGRRALSLSLNSGGNIKNGKTSLERPIWGRLELNQGRQNLFNCQSHNCFFFFNYFVKPRFLTNSAVRNKKCSLFAVPVPRSSFPVHGALFVFRYIFQHVDVVELLDLQMKIKLLQYEYPN